MLDDAQLLRQARVGSESAFRTLVDRHAGYLTGIAMSLCRSGADAEDLVQETFVASLTSSFRGESQVRTWLVQILVRQAAMLRRSRRRQDAAVLADAVGATRTAESTQETPGTDAKLDLAKMLDTLPPEYREVIVLRELQGLSYAEMADLLNVPRGTIESRLHRARNALRERYKNYF